MKSSNLSGNEQNVTNLGLPGRSYQKPLVEHTIHLNLRLPSPALPNYSKKANSEINAANIAEVNYNNSLSARTVAFDGYDGLITRSINALRIMDVPAQTLAQAEALVRELRLSRYFELLTDEELAAAKARKPDKTSGGNTIPAINSKLENLAKYVLLLESIPDYRPNGRNHYTSSEKQTGRFEN